MLPTDSSLPTVLSPFSSSLRQLVVVAPTRTDLPENMTMSVIDEYIASQAPERREILAAVHEAIAAELPEYMATMSYGMPTYRAKRNVIHFAANKKHLGIYPGPETIEHFAAELEAYTTSKGAVQFPFDKPIPVDLIGRMAAWSYQRING
ncbi:DUF1801 domain-containing protein [Arcanobacterium haemolyticum]|nr:DUF1801 domain-containing protein [Arcanobacterium haemolyticum]